MMLHLLMVVMGGGCRGRGDRTMVDAQTVRALVAHDAVAHQMLLLLLQPDSAVAADDGIGTSAAISLGHRFTLQRRRRRR